MCSIFYILVTEQYNGSNVYSGSELYMTYVVREPIERGMLVTTL